MSVVLGVILAVLYLYYIFQIGHIKEGILKNIVVFILIALALVITTVFSLEYLGILITTTVLLLFDLFYDEESFINQYKWIIVFGAITILLFVINKILPYDLTIVFIITTILNMYILLSFKRNLLNEKSNIILVAIILVHIGLAYSFRDSRYELIILALAFTSFYSFEAMLSSYNKTFKKKSIDFQKELLMNQYEEIKTVYLNMRGFRHDYHNHIQVIKAHLYMNRLDEVYKYLLELEGELERIDSRVRSGNLMLDAILNSKIAVAEKYNIKVTCKAEVPEKLPITDIDLCIILGNLLDNAIESCQKLENNTFIRIYTTILKKQLYISIQNSAKEDLNFNERNYITSKRGNHGLGMKRVKVLVDKYDGFLNLQNEPGIFAAEVTVPLIKS